MYEAGNSGLPFGGEISDQPPDTKEIIEPNSGLPLDVYLDQQRDQELLRLIRIGLGGSRDGPRSRDIKNRVRRIQDHP